MMMQQAQPTATNGNQFEERRNSNPLTQHQARSRENQVNVLQHPSGSNNN